LKLKIIKILAAAAILAALAYYLEELTIRPPAGFSYAFFVLSFLAYLLMTVSDAARWRLVVNTTHPGQTLTVSQAYLIHVTTTVAGVYTFSILSKTAGQAMLLKYAKDISLDKGVVTTLIPRLFDTLYLAVTATAALVWALGLAGLDRGFAVGVGLFIVAVTVVMDLFRRPLIRATGRRAASLDPNGRIGKHLDYGSFKHLLDPQAVRAMLYLSLVRYFLIFFRSYCLALALNLDIAWETIFFGVAFAQLGWILAVAPGAIGTLELGWASIFLVRHTPHAYVTMFLVWNRITEVAYVVLALAAAFAASGATISRAPRNPSSTDR